MNKLYYSCELERRHAATGRRIDESIKRITKNGFVIVSTSKDEVDETIRDNYINWCKEHNFDHEVKDNEYFYLEYRNYATDCELIKYLRSSKNKFRYTPIIKSDEYKDSIKLCGYERNFIIYNDCKNGYKLEPKDSWKELYNLALDICRMYCQNSVYIQALDENPKYVDKDGSTENVKAIMHAPTLEEFIERGVLYTRSLPSTFNGKYRRSSLGEFWDICK